MNNKGSRRHGRCGQNIVRLAAALVATMTACGLRRNSLPPPPPPPPPTSQGMQVAAGTSPFGLSLLARLEKEAPARNILVSPVSVSDCLALAYTGSGGQTRDDIGRVLGLGGMTSDSAGQGYAGLTNWVTRIDPHTQIDIANGIWVRQDHSLRPDYLNRCNRMGAGARSLDFNNPSAAETINQWASYNTKGLISNLVSPSDLGLMLAVLTNAVYFHGTWTDRFDKSVTHLQTFTLGSGAKKPVPMMGASDTYKFAETHTWQAVTLPYGNGSFAMTVVLPIGGHSVGDLVAGMSAKQWRSITGRMLPTEVQLSLPRFKVDYTNSLKDALGKMGMRSAFESADFSPMSPDALAIGDVIHKAVMEVDEDGTVAAAATAATLVESDDGGPAPCIMVVDHPFLVAITDTKTGALLFVGVVNDPQ
ncbi:MAG: serpin family protein [Capsulimonadaceae bacterium]